MSHFKVNTSNSHSNKSCIFHYTLCESTWSIISSSELSVKNLSVLHTAWFWKQNEQKLSFIYKIISESHSRCKNLKYEVLVFYLLTDRLCLAYLFVYVCETESEGELGEGRETYSKQVWCIFKQRKSELEFVKSCHLIYHLNNYICCLYLSSERTQVHYKFLRSIKIKYISLLIFWQCWYFNRIFYLNIFK